MSQFHPILPDGWTLQLREKFFSNLAPRIMKLDICGVCNAKCPFCARLYMPQARSKGFMEESVFYKALEEANKNKIKEIWLYSTSEPTLHPQFGHFVGEIKKNNIKLVLSTNASLLYRHHEHLAKLDVLQYSIEGWDRESYEKYRPPLKFDVIKKNIIDFWEFVKEKENRPRIQAHLLITKNVNIHDFLSCWGEYVDEITTSYLIGTVQFKNGHYISDTTTGIKEDYIPRKRKKNYFCGEPFNAAVVAFDGKMVLCCKDFSAELELGNIESGLKENYNSMNMKKIRKQFYSKKPDICKMCTNYFEPKETYVKWFEDEIKKLDHPYKDKIKF